MVFSQIALFFRKPIFSNYKFIFSIYLLSTLIISIQTVFYLDSNNYKIFYYSLQHLQQGVNMHAAHPGKYFDHYHYDPSFAVIFAPFFLLPLKVGEFFWPFFFGVVWVLAVYKMPLTKAQKVFAYWYGFQEYLTTTGNTQTNPLIAAIPLFVFICFEKKKPFWAAFFILLGFNVKIYSIVAAALFVVYPHKIRFIISSFFWGIMFALLPLLVTSPSQLFWQYGNWLTQLLIKTDHDKLRNISIHRLIHQNISPGIPTLAIVGAGIVLFCTVYFHWKAFANHTFKLLLLSSILIFQVIFQPAAESATYITAVTGVIIYWFVCPKAAIDYILIVACYILTVLSPTDFVPLYIKHEIVFRYVLKALPVVLVWFRVLYLMHTIGWEARVEKVVGKGKDEPGDKAPLEWVQQ